jgi:hypothetical protein
MCIEEGKEIQTKSIDNLFNKIIAKNFPNFKEDRVIQEQKAYQHQRIRTKKNQPH